MNLATDICLLKMASWAFLIYRNQQGSFILPKIIGIHFTFITKILGDIYTKENANRITFHRTVRYFPETNRLVPLFNWYS